jgi:hypothetical protein
MNALSDKTIDSSTLVSPLRAESAAQRTSSVAVRWPLKAQTALRSETYEQLLRGSSSLGRAAE